MRQEDLIAMLGRGPKDAQVMIMVDGKELPLESVTLVANIEHPDVIDNKVNFKDYKQGPTRIVLGPKGHYGCNTKRSFDVP